MNEKVPTFRKYLTPGRDTPNALKPQSTPSKKLEHTKHREEREIHKLEWKTCDMTREATQMEPGIMESDATDSVSPIRL